MHVDGMEECEAKMSEVVDDIRRLEGSLKRLKEPAYIHIKLGGLDPNTYYTQKIEENTQKHIKIGEELSKALTSRNALDDKISKLKQLQEGLISEIKLKDIKEHIESLKNNIEVYEKSHDTHPNMSMHDLTSDIDKLNMIDFHFNNIMLLNSDSVKYFCNKYDEFSGDLNQIDEFSRDRLITLHRKLEALKQTQSYKTMRNYNPIMYIPNGCKQYPKCPFYNAYGNTEESKEGSKIDLYESELAAIEDLSGIISSIYSIKKILTMRKPIDEYSVTLDNVINAIRYSDISLIVDRERIRKLRDEIAEYEDYVLDKEELTTRETEYKFINMANNHMTKEAVGLEIKGLESECNELSQYIDNLYSLRQRTNMSSDHWHEMMEDYVNSIKYDSEKARIQNEIANATREKKELLKLIEYKRDYDLMKAKYDNKLSDINKRIESVEKEIQNDHYRETMYLNITEEIERIKQRFDYVNDIKDATSQNGGIPLVHIKLYCRALCTIANNIIKDLYTGDFYLKEFDVREGVFNIPYYTKGFKVKDIRNGSQAEVSVAKLAISFAILSQFMTKYNIVLLDEIDGPMHRVNKERFFSALEGQLERLKCEQAFIITQSAMFNDYPVNLIVTDPDYRANLPNNATVIFQR
jgi:hypothetical protein